MQIVALTREQVAKRYSVSVRTIDNWRAKKIIPSFKIGGMTRFSVARLDAWDKEREGAETIN